MTSLELARAQLCFALDFPDLAQARVAAASLAGEVGVLKVGLELFVKEGPEAVKQLRGFGAQLFLDLKLHDIPATVERSVAVACSLGVDYLTLHAAGGPRMLEAAQNRVVKENSSLRLLAVTVLTSMDAEELRAVGVSDSPLGQVQRLAKQALSAGCAGLVCSVNELPSLRAEFGRSPVLVTPGIRPSGGATQDQARVGTAREAIELGSSLLVVGRPIRDAVDPTAAARALVAEIHAAATLHPSLPGSR